MIPVFFNAVLLIAVLSDRRPTDTGGVTERVSVSSSGEEADGMSMMPDISADGRFVAFESGAGRWVVYHSKATNLVPGDRNNLADIFVRAAAPYDAKSAAAILPDSAPPKNARRDAPDAGRTPDP
ncbi:MAG: hypothetical protein FLDDKLPJ_01896 [Phycisphaerae bacterium]|nr:hypothetical protein [Phycisphaerae bacterium]